MSRIKIMDLGDWIWLFGTGVVQATAVITAIGGWDELKTPAVIGGSVIAFATPFVTYFKQAPVSTPPSA